jgi:hypothetical protein
MRWELAFGYRLDAPRRWLATLKASGLRRRGAIGSRGWRLLAERPPARTLFPFQVSSVKIQPLPMMIVIHFHQSHYRDFKAYFIEHVAKHLGNELPGLVSYTRFVELLPSVAQPLGAYLAQRLGAVTGIAFIDSTPLPVCHNKRIARHRVFADLAARGKSSYG